MTAFALAMSALAQDSNLGVAAAWRAAGVGLPVSVRVVRSSPDLTAASFDMSIVQATDVVTVPVAAIATLADGDTFTIGAELLTVQHVERDAAGAAWRAFCRR